MDDTRRRVRAIPGLLAALLVAATAATATAPAAHAGPAPTAGPLAAAAPRTAAAAAAENAARLAGPRKVLAKPGPLTVAVIGDSVGNDPGEWVSMWAGDLATDRYAFVHHFDWKTARYSPDLEVRAPSSEDAAREPVTVRNFGWPGGTPARALEHLAVGVPTKPDLVVVSFGHNLAPGNVDRQYSALLRGLRTRFGAAVPVVVTLAHLTPVPRPGQAEGRARLARWASANRVPYVDLRGAFDGVRGPRSALHDAVHPNVLGYRLLTERFERALAAGSPPPTCSRAADRALVRIGRPSLTAFGTRRHTYRTTATVTDACGKRLPHAWVRLTFDAPTRVVVSTQTDARGVAPVEALLPNRTRFAVTAVADDGVSTGQAPTYPLTVR